MTTDRCGCPCHKREASPEAVVLGKLIERLKDRVLEEARKQ